MSVDIQVKPIITTLPSTGYVAVLDPNNSFALSRILFSNLLAGSTGIGVDDTILVADSTSTSGLSYKNIPYQPEYSPKNEGGMLFWLDPTLYANFGFTSGKITSYTDASGVTASSTGTGSVFLQRGYQGGNSVVGANSVNAFTFSVPLVTTTTALPACTVFFMFHHGSHTPPNNYIFSAGNRGVYTGGAGSNLYFTITGQASEVVTQYIVPTEDFTFVRVYFGNDKIEYQIGNSPVTVLAAQVADTNPVGGWQLFSNKNNTLLGNGDFGDFMVFTGYKGGGQATRIKQYLINKWQTNYSPETVRIHIEGDSLSEGQSATIYPNDASQNSWVHQFRKLCGNKVILDNRGITGFLLSTMVTNQTFNVTNSFDKQFRNNVCVIFAGTNDIEGGATGVATYNNLVTLAQTAKAAGYLTLVLTMLPRQDFNGTQIGYRSTYNTSLLANTTDFDMIVNMTLDAQLGDASPGLYVGPYWANGVHLTDAGYAIVAGYVKKALFDYGLPIFVTGPITDADQAAGSLLFADAKGDVFVDNQLFHSSIIQRTGIGTITPVTPLHILDAITGTVNSGLYIENTAAGTSGAAITLKNDIGSLTQIFQFSSTFSFGGWSADQFTIFAGGAGGVCIDASNASGKILFMTAGAGTINQRAVIDATGRFGIVQLTPTSFFHSGASFAVFYRTISALRTLDQTDHYVSCSSGTFAVTLPTAGSIQGRIYTVKNNGVGTITVNTTAAQTIDGAATVSLSTQFSKVTVISNGSNWEVIA